MNREEKVLVIDQLQKLITDCSIGILTDYRGLTNAEITTLRRKLDESEVKFMVIKNTLARLAAERAGRDDLAPTFEGPVAVAFSSGDETIAAKALVDYIRTSKSILSIKAGFIADRVLSTEEVTTLATLPSREVLIAKVMGGIQSPITTLLVCLAAPIRGIIAGLQARIQQLEAE
ncbi:50S ribosomal protein L10 [Chloroflexota bacterium]